VVQLSVVLLLHGDDSASSVELLSEDFVCVDESFKLLGEIIVLAQQNSRVTLKSIFFGQIIIQVSSHVAIGVLLIFNVFFDSVKILFLIFCLDIQASDLSR